MIRAILVFTIVTTLIQNSHQELRFLSGGGHGVALTNYNCTSNCLQCEVHVPHKCHKCLFQFFVDETSHQCKQCKVERCNLCAEPNKCELCRVGHIPKNDKCEPATWFVILAYTLFLLSFGMGILFFFISLFVCFFGKNDEHAHGLDSSDQSGLHEGLSGQAAHH